MRPLVIAVLLVALTGCGGDDPAPPAATTSTPADLPAGCPAPLAELDRELDEMAEVCRAP